jgi:hypothetical protein
MSHPSPVASVVKSVVAPRQISFDRPASSPPPTGLPGGTLHTELRGHVTFVPYPTSHRTTEETPNVAEETKAVDCEAPLVRVFFGQLPYGVTDTQFDWICSSLCGVTVRDPERNMRRRGNIRQPTGCLRAFCTEPELAVLIARLHKCVLVDDTGVWHATTDAERDALTRYVARVKADAASGRSGVLRGRPHDSLVVQPATSGFFPVERYGLSEHPTLGAINKPVPHRLPHQPRHLAH